MMKHTFNNPILPGFYPDPSICRVHEDYYLVTSSFEYFPGVPLFHSRDLVHWRQLGHVLSRREQLNLDGVKWSHGIYAPTIRYHDGKFYMITTLRTGDAEYNNFIVTATDPAGRWSDPYFLDGAPGIDPSLFFDDDGKVWYVGNRTPPAIAGHPTQREIWLQELDLETMQLTGPVTVLWDGALAGAIHAEAPHIYKINGLYYLMIAEGGTGHHHAVTIARSTSITGPYESNPANPIITHRHLGKYYPIVNTGHADLVQTQNGEWWMVLLASRPYGGYYRNLGRETFLAPVEWEDGWPVVSPGSGKIEFEYEIPSLIPQAWDSDAACDHFEGETLKMRWNFLRTPRTDFYTLGESLGHLRMNIRAEKLTEWVNPSFIGQRLRHMDFMARTRMFFIPEKQGEEAGIVLLQNSDFHFRFVCAMSMEMVNVVRLVLCEEGVEEILAEKEVGEGLLFLKVQAQEQSLAFHYATEPDQWQMLIEKVDGRILSTDRAGGFVGAYVGMYASSNGERSNNFVDFSYFEYMGT